MTTVAEQIPLHEQVRSFVGASRRMLIDGRWVEATSGKTFATYNPATGDVLSQVAEGDRADVNRAVTAARKAFENGPWRKLTASERGRLIWKLGDLIESHAEEFAQLESLDNGKPVAVARAADVPLAIDLFRYMAGWATKIEGTTIPISVPYTPGAQYLAYTLREPVGVVAQIIPWNFPLLMAAWKLGPALAAGCTVVLKLPGRRRERRARIRRDRRRSVGGPSGCRQSGLHRLDGGGKTYSRRGGRKSKKSVIGVRRKIAEYRV
jgi:phenylacetaldehyde dehydrogenase